jgi:hypothetical protein
MGRFCSRGLLLVVALVSLWSMAGCSSTKAGPPIFPGHITVSPATNASLTLGATMNFVASVQSASGTNISTPITYTSSDNSILNLAPNGVACAGHWDVAFTTCTAGNTGVVTVTASALGAPTSVPTFVFVHPQIENITVTGILLNGVAIQEPCLSQSQSMTVEAHAYSQGTDITASVGPFTWTANNPTVVNLIPLPNTTLIPGTNTTYNFPTNQATATATTPGISYIYANANGVSSNSFQQPQLTNQQGSPSPLLDFFSTCPIQNVALTLETAGSGQTSFVATKGTAPSETVIATLTDVMGNSSLPNTQGNVVLGKIPLTWSSSQPQAIGVSAACAETCPLSMASAGAATVTASCTPPSCNIGFPIVPATLSGSASDPSSPVSLCNQFFQTPTFNCQMVIPAPVYSSPVFITPPNNQTLLTPDAAISGVIDGTTSAASVLAASTGCASEPPATCSSSLYYLTTGKSSPGNQNPLPAPPNSFLWDLAGDKAYMGSNFGSEIITPANFGTSNNPFTPLGTVTGKILAISTSGAVSVFSDTIHTPNQVYVVNAGSTNTLATTPLNISSASSAGFSPDGLKAFIFGLDSNNNPSLFVYSAIQALQTIPLPAQTTVSSIEFSPNSAFAYAAEFSTTSSTANLTAYANCNNAQVATVPLPNNPILNHVQPIMKVLPNVHIDGRDSFGNPIPDGIHILILDQTGFDVITSAISIPTSPAPTSLCPQQQLTFISGDPTSLVQRIELGQGNITPVNFFASPDGTLLYVLSTASSNVLTYDVVAGSVTGGIQLQDNATPISADMSVDGGTIVVAGSDGMLHEVSTALGGSDNNPPLSFPSLPNFLNAFCTFTPSSGPCTLTTALTK